MKFKLPKIVDAGDCHEFDNHQESFKELNTAIKCDEIGVIYNAPYPAGPKVDLSVVSVYAYVGLIYVEGEYPTKEELKKIVEERYGDVKNIQISIEGYECQPIKAGDKVRALVELKSDDAENGIDDGCEVVPAGSEGIVRGRSEDFASGEAKGDEDCYYVHFGSQSYDCKVDELEVVK